MSDVEVVIATIPMIWTMCAGARADEIEQYEAVSGKEYRTEDMAQFFIASPGERFAIMVGDECIAAGGFHPVSVGVGATWMITTDASWRHWRIITRESKRVMRQALRHGYHRLETQALTTRTDACRWYEKGLGMKPDGVREGFCPGGQSMARFAMLKEVNDVRR